MRKLALIVLAVTTATAAGAATVVLKGGNRLEVDRYVQKGNYIIVQYADGRLTSYPLAAVDLDATRTANEVAVPTPAEAVPEGPHSPFFGAQAAAGTAAVTVTDADVTHVEEPEAEGEGETAKPSGQAVVLLGYDRQEVEPGVWEITATIANSSEYPVRAVNANVTLLDAQSKALGASSAAYEGELQPGGQGAVVARIPSGEPPARVSFTFTWQEIRPAQPQSGDETAAPAPSRMPQQLQEAPPRYEVPPGASPNTMPDNPNAMPPLTEPPAASAPQVPRPTPEPPGHG